MKFVLVIPRTRIIRGERLSHPSWWLIFIIIMFTWKQDPMIIWCNICPILGYPVDATFSKFMLRKIPILFGSNKYRHDIKIYSWWLLLYLEFNIKRRFLLSEKLKLFSIFWKSIRIRMAIWMDFSLFLTYN